jgi:hypothetical protein
MPCPGLGITDQIPERCLYTILAVSTTRCNATFLTGINDRTYL